ncbi:MAG TPA: 30S ribosome-binding factor RbfA [Lachnospiraceae bacterium]|nr:30S ribosome-binding factor RbfA [Lachnospiraceae bacterium]HPF28998.1 30S ribosome-binding factor RbfA [Lachnospiraceae bacterium]
MRKNSIKNTRINAEVLKILAEVIRSEIKDPRIPMMTSVVDVEVAPDLKTCKVWVSLLCDESEEKAALIGLKSAEGYMRKQLARELNLRNTPELRFFVDKTIAYGNHMSQLIDEVNKNNHNDETEDEA